MSEQQPASSPYPEPIGQSIYPTPVPPPMPASMPATRVPTGLTSVAPRKQGAWTLVALRYHAQHLLLDLVRQD